MPKFLDVALGMIYIYLLLSLVVTACGELVAALFRTRARMLEKGIERLLRDPKLVEEVYRHPLIESLGQDPLFGRWGTGRRPSYIPAKTFALTLLDIVQPATSAGRGNPHALRAAIDKASPPLQRVLAILLDQAAEDAQRFRESLEQWFDNVMDRVSGWYKRRSQTMVFALG